VEAAGTAHTSKPTTTSNATFSTPSLTPADSRVACISSERSFFERGIDRPDVVQCWQDSTDLEGALDSWFGAQDEVEATVPFVGVLFQVDEQVDDAGGDEPDGGDVGAKGEAGEEGFLSRLFDEWSGVEIVLATKCDHGDMRLGPVNLD